LLKPLLKDLSGCLSGSSPACSFGYLFWVAAGDSREISQKISNLIKDPFGFYDIQIIYLL
jgi:hypothetical protein